MFSHKATREMPNKATVTLTIEAGTMEAAQRQCDALLDGMEEKATRRVEAKRSVSSRCKTCFILGLLTWWCFYNMFMDWHGLEGYIAYLRQHWVNTPWWIWPVPIIAAYYYSGRLAEGE
jgi:hypothetical protein